MQKVQSNQKYKFGVKVWESNKGALGFCAWALHVYVPDLDWWIKVDGSHRYYPLHPDNAAQAAHEALDTALSGGYLHKIVSIFGEEESE